MRDNREGDNHNIKKRVKDKDRDIDKDTLDSYTSPVEESR